MVNVVGLKAQKKVSALTVTFDNTEGTSDKFYVIGDGSGYKQQNVAGKGDYEVNNAETSVGKTIESIVAEFSRQPIQVQGIKFIASDSDQLAQSLNVIDVSMDRETVESQINPINYVSNKQNLENMVDARFKRDEPMIWHNNRAFELKVLAGKKVSLTFFFGLQVGRN